MTTEEDDNKCPECGQIFTNGFDMVDHLLDEDETFDPVLILPNGYRLMIGSLLRSVFDHSDNPEDIRRIAESTFVTLFSAETEPDVIKGIVEDMIVHSSMADIDDELKQILEDGER